MLKSHEKFHSANGKRQILIADDELINREILKEMLCSDYEIITACDGPETLQMIRDNRDSLSLVLLDILMPGMSGLEVLKAVREDSSLSGIPVIVMTAEREAEIDSLNLGATDFIPKPYPPIGVILARVLRTIELFEDRDIIQSTERDELTGLYNKEFFYRYAEQLDQHHKDTVMDALIVDVNHFRMINERYGKAYGDNVLRRIGAQLRASVQDSGGIVCRREADTFMVYCPHREDYSGLMEEASVCLSEDDPSSSRVRLRMGIYAEVDKTLDIERRFDRAKMASDTVKGSFARNIGVYDSNLHHRQLYAEQLIEDFPAAIAGKQFHVFYQPKFDVRPDTPVLASAEALVRWIHPELGMINPGVFIPLFEENGLIERLDRYVWQETAAKVREWKDRLGYSVPVSVNVSRIDMYDPKLPDTFAGIMKEHELDGSDILLEVTESAYTQDSAQIIDMVEDLRAMGFRIEMDDFGTGYSSLNMISKLPIDVLKLDMQFIREAFKEGGNTHMLKVIIGIADFLDVPVIAEGVETQEQLHALKDLGCDIVQGYFFSKPVPAEEFEPFILQLKEQDHTASEKRIAAEAAKAAAAAAAGAGSDGAALAEASSGAAEGTAAGDAGQGPDADARILQARMNQLREEEKAREAQEQLKAEQEEAEAKASLPSYIRDIPEHSGSIQLKTASIFSVILALLAAFALLAADAGVTRAYKRMKQARDDYVASQLAATDMETGSDFLTDSVRCFVVTGDREYLNDFTEEVEFTKRRDKAVENLEELLADSESSALVSLHTALDLSNELVDIENKALRLMVEAGDYDPGTIPDAVMAVELSPEELALPPEEQQKLAQSLVFDNDYKHYKARIRENVDACTRELIRASTTELDQASAQLSLLANLQTTMTILFLLIVLFIVLIISQMIRKPLSTMVQKMQKQEMIPPTGVDELRYVTQIYNSILKENQEARERLSHEASHDALTGLFNRGAYDLLMESADTEHMALLLIDVDHFKTVNDTYGHAIGDRVLKRVADILRHSFRSVDILCRIGGDEFAVVMTRVNSSMKQLVINKIAQANNLLQHPTDDLPPVSLSVGVAFSDRENPQGDIFRDADAALYKVKEAGRKGCAVFE